MEFSPFNNVVKLCIQGMSFEERGEIHKALNSFLQALGEANNDFERFLGAFYIARVQENVSDRLEWLEKALQSALKVQGDTISSYFSSVIFRHRKMF